MKYHLCCLGSALVDITFQIDDEFTAKNEERGISKGAMTLIEKEDQNNLIIELQDLEKLKTVHKKIAEIWCLFIATIFSGFLAFYFTKMTYVSIKFEERSEGADEILIWIPQSAVALGSIIFFICVFHHLINSILGKKIK